MKSATWVVVVIGFTVPVVHHEADAAGVSRDPAVRPGAIVGPTVQNPGGPGTTIPVTGAATVIDFEDLGVPVGGTLSPPDFACVTSVGVDCCPGPLNSFNDIHAGNAFGSYAYNGTTVLSSHNDLILTRTDGMPFAMTQFDFAGFPGGTEPAFSVTAQPSGVSHTFTPDGVIDGGGVLVDFETFVIAGGFVGTQFVFVSTGVSSLDAIFTLDNICIGPPCAIPFGVGCAGLGGFVPALSQTVCDAQTGQVAFEIRDAPGGATALLLFGLTQASTPLGASGCSLNVGTLLPLTLAIPLGGAGPGNGLVLLPGVLPPSASGLTFTMTTAVSDASTPLGFTTSNGLEVTAP